MSFLDSKAAILTAKLDKNQPILGVIMASLNQELAELLAYVGFDYVIVDQMFTSTGWKELSEIVRSVRGSDMGIIARVENDPWYGGDDPGTSARVARAIGVGCDGVKVNVYSGRQARSAVDVAGSWHRYTHIVRFERTHKAFEEYDAAAETGAGALIIPSVESQKGIEDVDEILAIPRLQVFGIAMTDTTRMLGFPFQYEHPEVWRFVDSVVEKSVTRGIHICAGTGYAYGTWDEIAGRVARMKQHGINMIFLQTAEFLIQMATADLLKRVKAAIEG